MATTTNYGWTTPDDTALVKDGASAIRTLGTSVDTTTKNLNPSTTLGDIEYRSSTANTNTRLGIGSTGDILTVTAGVPAWAAPAAGGQTTITTGSVPTNAATFTISSIPSTYNDLILVIDDIQYTADEGLRLRMNGITTSTYNSFFITTNSNTISSSLAADNAYAQYLRNASDLRNIWFFPRYSQTGAAKTGYAVGTEVIPFGGFANKSITAAINSITIFNNGGNFTAGTYTLIGVK